MASRNQLIELVRSIAEMGSRGHDLVRRIEKPFLVRALNAICDCPPYHCPGHVKLIAQWCQRDSKDKGTRPDLSFQQIEREVLQVEFEDEAIRPGAERLGSGDPLQDWYGSLSELRRGYAGHYLRHLAKRFRLSPPESPHDDTARPEGAGG